ncbi:MAG: MATE family efflux transporter [Alphaproteobacteria bacterium]|nr:MATE family efflux transporter [Alphaproteobacteria bacterium]
MNQESNPTGDNAELTVGSMRGHLKRMAIPTWIGILAILAFNTVDTWFISLLGGTELAGLAFTYPVIFVSVGLTFGCSIAATALVSQAIGRSTIQRRSSLVAKEGRDSEGEESAADQATAYNPLDDRKGLATTALILVLLFFGSMGAVGFFTIEPLFSALRAPDAIQPVITAYLSVWYPIALPLTALAIFCDSLLRAYGDAKTPGILMTVGTLINLGLDPVLIFGIEGFVPALGVAGAAWATGISYIVLTCYYLYLFAVRMRLFRWLAWREFLQCARELIRVARASMTEQALEPATDFFIFYIIAPYGPEVIAAMGIAYRFFGLAVSPALALTTVVNPITGQNFGAKRIDRIELLWHRLLQTAALLSITMGLLFTVFGGAIVSVFTDNIITYAMAAFFLRLVMWTVGGYAIMASLTGILYGLDRSKAVLFIKTLQVLSFYVLPIYVAVSLLGGVGVVYAWAVGDLLTGLLAYLLYRFWVLPKLLQRR